MADSKVSVLNWLRKQISQLDTDLIRDMLQCIAEYLMSLEANELCGADHGEKSPNRVNSRNGYRRRRWDTRAGTIDLAIPRLRRGSYFPDWLLSPRRRSEKALVQVVCESYINGVSTRKVERLATAMGIESISKSQVSEMGKQIDELVSDFCQRPLDRGPYPYVWVDAITQRCREGGRVVNVVAVIATGVNAQGRRAILGVDVFTSENEAAWKAFLQSLVARGLSGVCLVVSDANPGLKAAIGSQLPGASWQRCRTHFAKNLLCKVPKSAQDFVATMHRSIFTQQTADQVYEQHRRVVEQLETRFPEAANMLNEAVEEILAFASFPKAHWRQIWSNNPQERINREIRRRTDVVSIFPHRNSVIRLLGAILAEQDDEWACARRYMSLESISQVHRNDNVVEEVKKLAA